MSTKKKSSPGTIAVNKKARYLYDLSDFTEAGISLTGPEVKSIRLGRVNFQDSYVEFKNGSAFIVSLHIAPYDNAGYVLQDSDRMRRLLLHAKEIERFAAEVEQKGLTVVPTSIYFKQGKIKIEIALGHGRKLHDHRLALKNKEEERDAQRELA